MLLPVLPPGPLPPISSLSSSRWLLPTKRLLRPILGESTPKLWVRKNFGAAHLIELFCLVDGSSKLMAVPKNLISFFVIGRRSQALFAGLSLAILLSTRARLSLSFSWSNLCLSVRVHFMFSAHSIRTRTSTPHARTHSDLARATFWLPFVG